MEDRFSIHSLCVIFSSIPFKFFSASKKNCATFLVYFSAFSLFQCGKKITPPFKDCVCVMNERTAAQQQKTRENIEAEMMLTTQKSNQLFH